MLVPLANKLKLYCDQANCRNSHVWNSHRQHTKRLFQKTLLLSNSCASVVPTANVAASAVAYTQTEIPTTRSSNMATQTRNTYISESMIHISEIPTGASSYRVPLGDCNSDRQPEMADET